MSNRILKAEMAAHWESAKMHLKAMGYYSYDEVISYEDWNKFSDAVDAFVALVDEELELFQ